MGSRGHIVVKQHPAGPDKKAAGEVYLYTHWGGEFLPQIVQMTLARQERWDDECYLTRMLFCALLDPEDLTGTMGMGISTYLTDNEFPLLILDTAKRTVTLRDPERQVAEASWSFEEFVALELDEDSPWTTLGYDDDALDEDEDEEDDEEVGARYFEFTDAKSSKFWEITFEGDGFSVRFGKIGTAGQSQSKEFDDSSQARKEYDKLVAEKCKKGYVEKETAG